nr:phosphatidylinositol 3,4,5-trisphosphate-dependent Rac exchanger 1 protein-like [Camelus dromedarius]
MDRTDHGGMKKVCVKLSEEDREDSGHDTMSYRDSYSECDSNQHSVLSYTSVRSDGSYLRSHEMRSVECRGSCWGRGASSEISFCLVLLCCALLHEILLAVTLHRVGVVLLSFTHSARVD